MSVYSLCDPRTGRVRYVGMSRYPVRRRAQHIRDAHSERLRTWVSELRTAGFYPSMRILGRGTERQWIRRLRPDLNVARGEPIAVGDLVCVSLRFPRDLFIEAESIAVALGISLNDYVVKAIMQHTRNEKRRLATAEPAAPHGRRGR